MHNLSRSAFLELSGVSLDRFVSMRRRDQLPFRSEGDDEKNARIKYDARDVVFMLCMRALSDEGIDLEKSARFLRNNPELVINYLDRAEGEDIWIACGTEKTISFDFGFAGTFAEIAAEYEQLKADFAIDDMPFNPSALFMVSLSRAVFALKTRALMSGVALSSDWKNTR